MEGSGSEAGETSINWVRKYGGIVHYRHLLGEHRILVADPQGLRTILVKEDEKFLRDIQLGIGSRLNIVLLTNDGAEHSYQRKLVNPHFTQMSLNASFDIFLEQAQDLKNSVEDQLKGVTEKLLPIQNMVTDCVKEFICRYAFGEFPKMEDSSQNIVTALMSALSLSPIVSFTQTIPILGWLPTKSNRALAKNIKFANDFVKKLMEDKRAKLMTDQGKEEMKKDLVGRLFLEADSSKPLTEDQVAGLISTIIFAGFQTTSTAITWCLHILSEKPDIQEKIAQEVAEVMVHDGCWTWSNLDKLVYLDAVFKESQRLIPIVSSVLKKAQRGAKINGYDIPEGTVVVAHLGAAMRNPHVWEDPDEFKPERFLNTTMDKYMYQFLPFGTGAHKCLGHQLAKVESRLILALLIQNFIFERPPGYKVRKASQLLITPNPKVELIVKRRN
ncbi:DgyrCDS12408 [Dimorphilus gyrociliatus]|uniref:DgyrCDS12408 n=1 Tax=Dimorphilus gyrociliatus TaxID=2664684 RepID=A0A7I8W7L3_9ANNE|nr:DgyrCDS12408 [Dimorphilus gyrociliatus]